MHVGLFLSYQYFIDAYATNADLLSLRNFAEDNLAPIDEHTLHVSNGGKL